MGANVPRHHAAIKLDNDSADKVTTSVKHWIFNSHASDLVQNMMITTSDLGDKRLYSIH
jgi:hypothetical protein